MTLILELPIEIEARLKAEARALGIAPEMLALETMRARYEENADNKRREAAAAGLGMFAGRGRSVDEFLAERHAEGEAEYEKWIESRSQD